MIAEDYCSFELSKLLKEKGFDEPCNSYYTSTEMVFNHFNCYYYAEDEHDKVDILTQTLRPTHQMAMKWLREKHNIIITPQPEYFSCDRCESWGIDIWAFDNYEKLPGDFSTYEEAVDTALKYSLENLI